MSLSALIKCKRVENAHSLACLQKHTQACTQSEKSTANKVEKSLGAQSAWIKSNRLNCFKCTWLCIFFPAVGETASENSPCSKGAGLIPVAFSLRASFADMSQQEPLLVSWSLSAWSLSP